MKVRYVFPLSSQIEVEDHWPVPLLAGQCRLVQEDGLVTAIEFTKAGLSTDLAFGVEETPDQKSKMTITDRDSFLPIVRSHVQRAFSFIQCYFDTGISVDEVEVYHEAETSDEEVKISVPKFRYGASEQRPLTLNYDMFTRALMAADEHDPPEFVSSLASLTREAFKKKRYIDAFRFGFLLIEALHGGGKFKSKQLKSELSASTDFRQFIHMEIGRWGTMPVGTKSETLSLMNGKPTAEQVIDHLVDMRGHYFHGNLAKKDAWNPAKQEEAEALAVLTVGLAQSIAHAASTPMFKEDYSKRHFEDAGAIGAHVVVEVTYRFRVPEDELIRTKKANFVMPGTKATTRMAMEAAWRSIQHFTDDLPVGRLHSVSCKNSAGGEEVFEARFLTEPDGKVVED